LAFVCLVHFVVNSSCAAVFTTNLTLSETNTAYDGQDIVIDGNITVTIDGPHAFNSLLATDGAILAHA
jgi:hypothetical protein